MEGLDGSVINVCEGLIKETLAVIGCKHSGLLDFAEDLFITR